MKYILLLLVVQFVTCESNSQVIKKFIVFDRTNKTGIPFVTIRMSYNNYFCTDDKGNFEILDTTTASLKISCIGYYDTVISRQNFSLLDTIFLKEKVSLLDNVTVNSTSSYKNYNSYGIVRKKHDFSFACDSSFNAQQFALQINIPENIKNYLVEKIHIRLRKSKETEINIHPVRLHIYSCKDGIPDKELLENDIVIKEKDQISNDRELEVSLTNQYVIMTERSFFIGIEFLKTYANINYNEPQLLISTSSANNYTFRKNFYIRGRYYDNWTILAEEGLFDTIPISSKIHSYNILAWADIASTNNK